MRRTLALFALIAALSTPALGAAVAHYESVTLSLLVPPDQENITRMEKDLHEIHGFGGVTWDLPAKKCTITINASVLCRDDLIKALNERSLDGKPRVALYITPDARTSLAEIQKVALEMEAVYQKTKVPKDLLPFLERMGPHVEALSEAVRQKEPPTRGGKLGPTYEKARELAVRVYALQSVAKRDYPETTEKAFASFKVALDDLAVALGVRPATEAPKPVAAP